ncbi:MAG: hypothetical protein JSU90_10750 [Nitrospiraceae bacterium]|nr:MAG: hypothetical protein JSU90_10750 [Nitrospiraceae bacterium]
MNALEFAKNIRAAVVLMVMVLVSCAPGTYLRTEPADESAPGGMVTLFLYGTDTPLQVAIMDIEGDGYTFSITGSSHLYTVKRNISADQARQEVLRFMAGQRHRWGTIRDSEGKVIGHDVRPLYHILLYGASDILDITYRLDGTDVFVSVSMDSTAQTIYNRDRYGGE